MDQIIGASQNLHAPYPHIEHCNRYYATFRGGSLGLGLTGAKYMCAEFVG